MGGVSGWGRFLAAAGLSLMMASLASGQTLARKGWEGSGINVEPWWKDSILYQVDPLSFQPAKGEGAGDLRGIADHLDYLASLGVDLIVLSPLQLEPGFERNATEPAFDPRLGTAQDFDQLVAETGRRKMRLIVDLPIGPARSVEQLGSLARFWFSRGVGGLRLTRDAGDHGLLSAAERVARVRELRRIAGTYMGQRILIWDQADQPAAAGPVSVPRVRRRGRYAVAAPSPRRDNAAQMAVDRRLESIETLDATLLRSVLGQLTPAAAAIEPVVATDGSDRVRSASRFGAKSTLLAQPLAAALMTLPAAPLLYFGQEIGMTAQLAPMPWEGDPAGLPNVGAEDGDTASLLNWYRKLAAVRHDSAVLRNGSFDLLPTSLPDVVAWVRRQGDAAPVLVVLNLADHAEIVPLSSELGQLGVPRGAVLHTLATTGPDTPQTVGGLALGPDGVYVGELRTQPGLESVTLPARSSRGRRSSR